MMMAQVFIFRIQISDREKNPRYIRQTCSKRDGIFQQEIHLTSRKSCAKQTKLSES